MSKPYRRFEMLLPLLFNDGQPVPEGLIAETLVELEQKFGAVSSETQTIHGRWHQEGVAYRDDLVRVFVDVPDEPEVRPSGGFTPSRGARRAGSTFSVSTITVT